MIPAYLPSTVYKRAVGELLDVAEKCYAGITRDTVETADLVAARTALHQAFGAVLCMPQTRHSGGMLSVCNVDAGCFGAAHVALPGDQAFTADGHPALVIQGLIGGEFTTQHGNRTTHHQRGEVFIANFPDAHHQWRTRELQSHAVRLPTKIVTEVASGTTPSRAVVRIETVQSAHDPSKRALWLQTSRYLDQLLFQEPFVATPLVLHNTARLLAAVSLQVFPNIITGGATSPEPRTCSPRTLRRAMAFIESNAHRPIGVTDIAEAACATPRAIQYAFQRALEITPMQYLRRVRLSGAHRDLLEAHPPYSSVTRIAAHWGFRHTGRFAAHYRHMYGRSPHVTLQSRRRSG